MGTYIFLGLVVLIVIIVVSAGVKIVPQSETRVVERLGRFHSVLSPDSISFGLLSTSRR